MIQPPDKINALNFTVLTARSRGAIACLHLQGPNLAAALSPLFRPANTKSWKRFEPGSIIYGQWYNGAQEGEDVVVCPLNEKEAEVHCHGGIAAVEAISNSLEKQGFQSNQLGQYGSTPTVETWEFELRRSLSLAPTERTARHLLQQFNRLRDQEELFLEMLNDREQRREALKWADFGLHLVTPWTVTFFGRPNVGKSSLINALAGFNRAIVHETAGTTRDVVRLPTAVEGWPVILTDTAGIRITEDAIESQGIDAAMNSIRSSNAKILVVDAQAPELDEDNLQFQPHLVLLNKSDLASDDLEPLILNMEKRIQTDCLSVSATTGLGLKNFTRQLAKRLVPVLPPPDLFLPTTPRMIDLLKG